MKTKGMARWMCAVLAAVLVLGTVPAQAAEPEIVAEAAVVMDYDTGEVVYAKDADTMRVPASMTKVMTAYIIFEELEAGRLTLDTQVEISEKNAELSRDPSYPAMVPLPAGETVSVDTLLKLILLPSASASCIVMAEYIAGTEEAFVQRMNETARRLGLTAAYENCHGAFPHNITARSQAQLVRAFIQRYPQVLDYTSLTQVEFGGKTYTNTNYMLTKYLYEGCDGFKTGTIPEAGYCLAATAERSGRRLIAVVMKSSSDFQRFADASALLDYGFACLEQRSLVFDDIATHWARPAIEALERRGAALPAYGGDFRPQEPVTRGEFAAMLASSLGLDTLAATNSNHFLDLDGIWAEPWVRRAIELGLMDGVSGDLFAPQLLMTREAAMVALDRSCGLPAGEAPAFADSASISPWAAEAVGRVTAAGLMGGDSQGNLNPQAPMTRAEAAVAVWNAVQWLDR